MERQNTDRCQPRTAALSTSTSTSTIHVHRRYEHQYVDANRDLSTLLTCSQINRYESENDIVAFNFRFNNNRQN